MVALYVVACHASLLTPQAVPRAGHVAAMTPLLAYQPLVPVRTPPARMFDLPTEEPDEDAFEEIIGELTGTQKRVKDLNPLIFSTGANAVTVVGALLAWFIVPPLGSVGTIGSLGVGGFGGRQLSKKLKKARRGVVPAAIAEMVKKDGIDGLKTKTVQKLAGRYGVTEEEFEAQLSTVYQRYLRQLLGEEKGPSMGMVKELGALRRGIGLRWNATATVHAGEAREFLDGEAPPSVNEMPAELSALFWISNALFATSKSQASAEELKDVLGADEAAAQILLNELSRPM